MGEVLKTVTSITPTLVQDANAGTTFNPIVPTGYLENNNTAWKHLASSVALSAAFDTCLSGQYVDSLGMANYLNKQPRFIMDGGLAQVFGVSAVRVSLWDNCTDIALGNVAALTARAVYVYVPAGRERVELSARLVTGWDGNPLTASTTGGIYFVF